MQAVFGRSGFKRLRRVGKDEDADAIKSWLRSQYADNIRERRRALYRRILTSLQLNFIAGCVITRNA